MKQAAIIVDGSNLFRSMKRNRKVIWPPELAKLLLPLIGNINPICKIHYFTSFNRKNKGQQRALNKISLQSVIVYTYDLKEYPDKNLCPECNDKCSNCGRDLRIKPHREKMVDIAISTKLLELGYQNEPFSYDTLILISGDKDLIPTIQFLRQKLGKEVIVAGFRHTNLKRNSLAYELDREVDKIINFIDIL